MNKSGIFRLSAIFILLLLVGFYFTANLPTNAQIPNSPFAPNRILIKFRPNVDKSGKNKLLGLINGLLFDFISPLNVNVVLVPQGKVAEILQKLKGNSDILYAEPDYVAYALEVTNDPYLNNQWGLFKIQAANGSGESAWNLSKGNSSIKIAIVDTGIDQNHIDLQSKITGNKNCTNSRTVDDRYGHGTHVAGIAAAVTNNAIGIAGAGYNTRLLNAKSLADNGSGYYSWIANCIIWAADNGASVINMSLGGSASSSTLEDAINYAWGKGAVLFAAAGNSGSSQAMYPAYYSQVVAVAATDNSDHKTSWSNYGNWVEVAAPGNSIYSTLPNHTNSLKTKNYGYLSGTSMATPFASGLAALIKSLGENNNNEILQAIFVGSDQIEGTGSYWQYGRINALKSIQAVSGTVIQPTATPTITPTLTPSLTPTPPIDGSSPTPTPTRTPTPTKTPTPTPWWCARWPTICR